MYRAGRQEGGKGGGKPPPLGDRRFRRKEEKKKGRKNGRQDKGRFGDLKKGEWSTRPDPTGRQILGIIFVFSKINTVEVAQMRLEHRLAQALRFLAGQQLS